MALWGRSPKYVQGAIENAKLLKVIYPGWILRIIAARDVPTCAIEELLGIRNVEVVICNDDPGNLYMFKRFEIADDPLIDIALIRDSDSRFSQREARAVRFWLKSGKKFHIMRDHPHHAMPIMGGMWGVRKDGYDFQIKPLIANFLSSLASPNNDKLNYGDDQEFLRDYIYPIAKKDAVIHDDFYAGSSWNSRRQGLEFVGQVFDEHGFTDLSHINILHREVAVRARIFGLVGFAKKSKVLLRTALGKSQF
jgi:hypothetical protein